MYKYINILNYYRNVAVLFLYNHIMGASKETWIEEREQYRIEHNDVVLHNLFGQGVVLNVSKNDKIAVKFKKFGVKCVKANGLMTSYQEIKRNKKK